jgi:hypothetical protein
MNPTAFKKAPKDLSDKTLTFSQIGIKTESKASTP